MYIDEIPKDVKAEIKSIFKEFDLDGNGYVTIDDINKYYVDLYNYYADEGIPLYWAQLF